MEDRGETFYYTYSAKKQEEINDIRSKYLPREEDKMKQLRRLDKSATRPGTIVALIAGIISTLLFGVGMCCVMVWREALFIPGIIIGVLGLSGVSAAYPLYTYITRRRREKLAPEILRLTDELTK